MVQISMILAVFSSLESKPFLKCNLTTSNSFSASSKIFGFSGGTIKSSIPQVIPERVEYSNPKSLILSRVSFTFSAGYLTVILLTNFSSFLELNQSSWKGKSSGRASLNKILPTEVSKKAGFG